MREKYKISVIIPIYNVEEYLEETIESVLKQTIGFKKNIELILINDGSPDNSEKICLKYKEKYPNNVIYIKQENRGVSNARNNGVQHATGELVTFLDSDDKWSEDSFKIAYDFWTQHKEVKILSCKMVFFDARRGGHPLNYKYKENKIVDITKDYKYIQLSSSSAFIERETLLKYRFDEKVKHCEDAKLMAQMLFDNYKMAVLKEPTYYYRRRGNKTSTVQNATKTKEWFLNITENVYKSLIELSVKKFGKIIDYLNYFLAYEIGWRININNYEGVLNNQEQEKYINIICELIQLIEFKFFEEQKHISLLQKLYILSLKNNKSMKEYINIQEGYTIINLFERPRKVISPILIDNAYIRNEKLYMFGRVNIKILDQEKLKINIDNKNQEIEFYDLKTASYEMSYKNEYIIQNKGIKVVIDLNNVKNFYFEYNKQYIMVRFGKRGMFTLKMDGSYYTNDKILLRYDKGKFIIEKNTFSNRIKRQTKNIVSLLKQKKLKQLLIRMLIIFTRPFFKKNIWIISDRINMARDNGEHLFRYLIENKIKNIKPYFVILKSSPDYNRMKKIGKVVSNDSLKYKILFAHSKYFISSQADFCIINPFGKSEEYYRDLINVRYIFLQHGIIKDDMSSWLNPNTIPIDMFITTVKSEYKSILKSGYDENIVKMLGMARFDKLLEENNTKKQILLLPTWRKYLSSPIDVKNGDRKYNEDFKNSEFYKFYNNLVNNEKIVKFLKESGYIIMFCPHPNMLVQVEDFKENDIFKIKKGNIDYQQEIKDAAFLITDYSSVAFDMAYLKKPSIYTQFDEEEFYKGQIYDKGDFFNCSKDGFGDVCKDIDTAVEKIIDIIKNDCKIEEKYLERVNKFFDKIDDKNCERIYKEIINLK